MKEVYYEVALFVAMMAISTFLSTLLVLTIVKIDSACKETETIWIPDVSKQATVSHNVCVS